MSGETDPNKLYDLIATMEEYQVYSTAHVEQLVDLYLNGAERDRLDPILDACTAVYKNLDTEEQIKFKSSAKAFCRTYGFLGAILPYGDADWEKLSIFLNLLIPKLPSPRDDDFSEGILDVIDLDSYRLEAQESMSIKLEDADAEVAPVPAGSAGHIVNPEMDLLSIILNDFNDMFGNIDWKEPDNVRRQIIAIPDMVAKDEKYQNAMKNSDKQNARMESERALQQVIFSVMADNMELFKQFQDNPSFKKWLSDMVFNMTYEPNAGSKVVKYPEPKPTMSMVAEDTVPYGDKGLTYPPCNGGFVYADVIEFFNKLSDIFDWPIYEKSTLGSESKRKWYAVILCQWMEGSGLSYIMKRAIEYHKTHPDNFRVSAYQPPTTYNDRSKEHRNVVFADTLEVIENVILFSISNYFLRFSNEYKKVHDVTEFDNNWYEYVEFGTTNPLTILLQRNGFSRESATYIRNHKDEYVVHDGSGGELKLKSSLLICGNTSVMTEAASIKFNVPGLFLEEDA